jgi:hypothetical protein
MSAAIEAIARQQARHAVDGNREAVEGAHASFVRSLAGQWAPALSEDDLVGGAVSNVVRQRVVRRRLEDLKAKREAGPTLEAAPPAPSSRATGVNPAPGESVDEQVSVLIADLQLAPLTIGTAGENATAQRVRKLRELILHHGYQLSPGQIREHQEQLAKVVDVVDDQPPAIQVAPEFQEIRTLYAQCLLGLFTVAQFSQPGQSAEQRKTQISTELRKLVRSTTWREPILEGPAAPAPPPPGAPGAAGPGRRPGRGPATPAGPAGPAPAVPAAPAGPLDAYRAMDATSLARALGELPEPDLRTLASQLTPPYRPRRTTGRAHIELELLTRIRRVPTAGVGPGP